MTILLCSVCAAVWAQEQQPSAPDSFAPGTFDPLAVAPDAAPSESAAASASRTKTGVAPTVVDGLGKGFVELTGPWQFHTGDDPAWAAPGFDDSQWERQRGSEPWGQQGHPGYNGFAWYRLHLVFDPAPGSDPDVAIALDGVQDAYELYWNGAPIGRNGKLPPNPAWYYNQPAQTFGLGPAREGVLAIRVWKAQLEADESSANGGLMNAPLAGSPQAIANAKAALDYRWLRSQQLNFALKSLFGLVAILSLIAWLRDRSQWYLFWITVYAIFPVIYLFLYEVHLPLSNWAMELGDGVRSIENFALSFLLLWLLDIHKESRYMRRFRAVLVVVLVASFLQGMIAGFAGVQWDGGFALNACQEAIPFGLAIHAVRRRRHLEHSRWIVAIFACLQQALRLVESFASRGRRDLHWTFADKLGQSLFTFNGNRVDAGTVADTLLLLSIVYAVYRYSAEIRQRQTLLEQEFQSARELQQVLIPETLPMVPGFALTSAYRPAQEVGGDFFQIIPLTGESTLIVLGDVSGKGLRAAMMVSLIVGAIHALANEGTNPGRFLFQLNRRLYGRMQGGFVTCIALRVSSTGSCSIASAGHPGPYFNSQELALPGSLPLGLTLAAAWEDMPFRFRVDDQLSLFTDGLLEAKSASGELFGFDRLQALFASKPTATEASEAAVAFGQDDDITVLTLTRLSTGQESTAVYSTLKTLTRPILKDVTTTARIKAAATEP